LSKNDKDFENASAQNLVMLIIKELFAMKKA